MEDFNSYIGSSDYSNFIRLAKDKREIMENNLRHIRNFYLTYPKCDALRPE